MVGEMINLMQYIERIMMQDLLKMLGIILEKKFGKEKKKQ